MKCVGWRWDVENSRHFRNSAVHTTVESYSFCRAVTWVLQSHDPTLLLHCLSTTKPVIGSAMVSFSASKKTRSRPPNSRSGSAYSCWRLAKTRTEIRHRLILTPPETRSDLSTTRSCCPVILPGVVGSVAPPPSLSLVFAAKLG
jgi:hypothetical protein